MTTIDSSILTPTDVHDTLVRRLGGFRRRVRGRFLLEGAARVLAIAVALGFLTLLLDRTFRLSLPARVGMASAVGITVLVFVWREIISPLRLKLDALTLAAAMDEDGSLTARVGSVLELPGLLERSSPPSAAMVRRAVLHCHESLVAVDFNSRLDDRRRNVAAAVIAGALLVPLVFAVVAPNITRLWAARILFGSNEPWPQRTYLQVAGLDHGALVAARGEPFVLRVSARSGSVVPETISLRYREGGGSKVNASLTAFGPNDFRYDFASIQSDVEAEIWGGDDVLEPFFLRPADRPRITDLKLTAQHPTEAKPSVYTFSGTDADLSFLPKTRMRLAFSSNTPIAEAHLKSSTTQPAAGDLRCVDDQHFDIGWTQEKGVQMEIELVSRDANLSSVPTAVAIGLKTDQAPRLTLAYSGVKQRVTPRARIPLTIDARDDYGVAKVALAVKAETPDPANPAQLKAENMSVPLFGPVDPASEKEVQPAHTLELEPMKLPPGSLVTVNAAATDACYTGAQTSTSRAVTFRVVPPEELFREILLRQQSERAKFRKQADEARNIREALTTLSNAEAMAQVSRRHRAVQREATRVAAALADTLIEMRLNALGTDEAYDLMQKNILTPLKGLNDELMNPQKDAMDALRPEDSKALADAQERQDRIVTRMEEILKQMSQWDSFVDVLNQLNEIIKLQDQAQQTTTELKKKETEGVFEK